MQVQSELSAAPREDRGKGPSRRLRRTGSIPAVLYSAGKDPIALSVDPKALTKAISTPLKMNTIISLGVDGASAKRNVLVKDMQRDPIRRNWIHADFIEVDLNKPVKINVPILLTGKIKNLAAGAVVEQVTRAVAVMAMPSAIPEKIEFDISEMKMGQSVHVSNLQLPPGLTIIGEGKETVATVVAVAEEKAATPAEGAAVTAEGAAAAAPGAAPAAGAAPADAKAAAGAKPGEAAKAAPAKEEAKKK